MIVRHKPGLLTLFFVMRGSVVPRILPHILGFAAYGALIVAVCRVTGFDVSNFSLAPFGLLGVALSVYMGFRNNAAYDRWWEARKIWGELVYEIRNLARVANGLVEDRTERRALLMEALAFCHFLRGQLRGVDVVAEARNFIGDDADAVASTINRPDALVRRMGRRAAILHQKAAIDAIGYRILDERLATIAAVQAGCERIKGTPLPFAYTLLLQRTAHIFCLLLPFGLVASAGWVTPLFTALVAYTFFGLDALSEELEDPFGMEANDLALDAICRVCEISIFEALDEPPPVLLRPERYFYS